MNAKLVAAAVVAAAATLLTSCGATQDAPSPEVATPSVVDSQAPATVADAAPSAAPASPELDEPAQQAPSQEVPPQEVPDGHLTVELAQERLQQMREVSEKPDATREDTKQVFYGLGMDTFAVRHGADTFEEALAMKRERGFYWNDENFVDERIVDIERPLDFWAQTFHVIDLADGSSCELKYLWTKVNGVWYVGELVNQTCNPAWFE